MIPGRGTRVLHVSGCDQTHFLKIALVQSRGVGPGHVESAAEGGHGRKEAWGWQTLVPPE